MERKTEPSGFGFSRKQALIWGSVEAAIVGAADAAADEPGFAILCLHLSTRRGRPTQVRLAGSAGDS